MHGDLVFEDDFCDGELKFENPDVDDNLWILDNIRDSIMHGQFTVNFAV